MSYRYWLLPSPTLLVPLEYILRSPSPSGWLFSFRYSCYSVTSIRTFMHTSTCRNRVYLSLSTSLPGCPPPKSLSRLFPSPIAFSRIYAVVFFYPDRPSFLSPFPLSPLFFLSSLLCRLFLVLPYSCRLYLSSIDINSVFPCL